MVQIRIDRWAFWSPESCDPASWLRYWQEPGATPATGEPDVSRLPASYRRRMSRLSKMALSTAFDVVADQTFDYSIFCSQHGEIVRSRELLASIAAGVELSPAAFSQSVHNTSSGLFTVIAETRTPSTSIASGENTFAYGWIEAQAYLTTHPKHRVLLIDFDEVVPAEYQGYSAQVYCDHALALMLSVAQDGGISMAAATRGEDDVLPQGPQFAAWMQSWSASFSTTMEGKAWRWDR